MPTTARSRRDHSAHELMESFERRCLFDSVAWDGGGGDGAWANPLNWNRGGVDVVPQNGDDVTINISPKGGVSFTAAAGVVTLNSLTTTRPLAVSGGSLSVVNAFSITSAALSYSGGNLAGTPTLLNSTLSLTPAGASGVTFIAEGNSTLSGNLNAGQTLWVRGSNTGANATLAIPATVTNAGTIRLESAGLNWQSNIGVAPGATLINTGSLQINLGSAGQRLIAGDVRNQGTFTVAPDVSAEISNNLGTFTHAAGTITTGGGLRVFSGLIEYTGGSIIGAVQGSNVNVRISATQSGTIAVDGSSALVSNIPVGPTLWVRGSNTGGNSVLHIPANYTNAGTIRMESIGQNWQSNIVIDPGATLTNTGTIQSNLGAAGERSIFGSLTNTGNIASAADSPVLISGTFTAAGGIMSGPHYVVNSAVNVTADALTPTTINLIGNNTLQTNNRPGYTLWIHGSNPGANATLTILELRGIVKNVGGGKWVRA
mgnify:CR=1 FL=1